MLRRLREWICPHQHGRRSVTVNIVSRPIDAADLLKALRKIQDEVGPYRRRDRDED